MIRKVLAAVLPAALVAGAVVPALASPVCDQPPREPCGGRIFAEPELSVSFVQHDNGEFEAGIKALEAEFPRFVRVRSYTQFLGRETLSAGGRDIWLIEVTDRDVPEKNKVPVAVSLSVHGPERAGLEGGVRYAEDLARWATDEPDHELRNGTNKDSIGISTREALGKVHLYLTNANPDGWADGDLMNGGVFTRGNANGVDLNREFPTKGWTKREYTPLSEPESVGLAAVLKRIGPVTASDLHGELTSANNAYADIMYPAGQWDPRELKQEERLARHMTSNVGRYFEQEGIAAGEVTGVAGMKPAEYATAYDVVGYDDSGFMGDYFTERLGAVEVDVEHFFSHMAPNSTWVSAHEDAHVAAVRAEIETLIVESLVARNVKVRLRLGKVGYLWDPKKVTSRNGYGGPAPPNDVSPKPYSATRMRYFKDLGRFTTKRVRRIERSGLSRRSLRRVDTFVVAGRPFPKDTDGPRVTKKRVARVLRRFTKRGGNLILTDRALRLLPRLGVVGRKAVRRDLHNAGHVNIERWKDRYLKKVHTTASQTYYEVPLGYSVDVDSAPHFTVRRGAWEKKGGKTIAYVTDENRVGLGRMKLGKGTLGIFGAILPDPTERYDHFFGLADYAVTVAGGQILNNMLALGR